MQECVSRRKALPFIYTLLLACVMYGGNVHGGTSEGDLILSEGPEYVALDMTAGVFVVRLDATLVGYDVDTGAERWSFALERTNERVQIVSGKSRLAVLYPKKKVLVLDNATGQEVWHSVSQQDGDLLSVSFIKRSDWFLLGYRRTVNRSLEHYDWTTFLHEPEGERRYRLPENHAPVAFSPSGQQLGLWTFPQEGPPYPNKLVYWDYRSGLIEPGSNWPYETMLRFTDILASGAVLAYDVDEGDFIRYILSPETSPTTHPLGDVFHFVFPPRLLEDRRRILMPDPDPGTVRIYDGETQEALWTLQDKDHTFISETLSVDPGGRQWILSRDYLRHGWLWPVEPEGRPRRIFDASAYNPGEVYGIHRGHVIIGSNRIYEKTRRATLWARKLEDMSVTAVWEMAPKMAHDKSFFYLTQILPCSGMVRCMAGVGIQLQENEPFGEHALIYERGNEAPLLGVQGRAQTLSPDGRHAVISAAGGINVYHVDAGTPVIEVASEKNGYVLAVFSMDGTWMAAYNNRPQSLRIWRLDEGYKETVCHFPQEKDADRVYPYALSFSPDGSLLLAAGRGRAWLYDTESGVHLRTLAEPRRFISRRPGRPRVWGVELPWLTSVEDFAGRFTDRFKNQPDLQGEFSANGRHAFTLADNRLLRMWDLETGRFLRIIEPAYPDRRSAPGAWIFTSITLSENGEYAFFADKKNKVGELWEVGTGRQVRQYALQIEGRFGVHVPDDGSCVYFFDGPSVKRLPGKETQ